VYCLYGGEDLYYKMMERLVKWVGERPLER
jgi:hypothetical protein